ncbi:alpha-L-fucosidase [Coraliomargarita sp. SDUM461003]|uniref:alpha-L-fucosidase n=1 Tax=Thalassobacterium maritimum TaxID=3041265 RepID=A0ABU1AVX2_9BACT|nr:alpha-L-fucosidase [Coraliomargarita sp. SDUM461003]MDQ8208233.1 alpha-L-fucosidase [Coraliomargarita sp. SDUM461003]
MKKIIPFVLSSLLVGHALAAANEMIPESDAAYQERMQWFTDAKFGLFIHYGVYSTLGGEWKGEPIEKYAEWIQRWGKITPEEYIPLAADFRPDALDADAWVKRAKEAGMQYMVITTKHHEGFCLWDSEYTEYDLGEANDFQRDILGELKAACDKYGVKFGTYYSIIDWHHSSQRAEQATNRPPMRDKEGYVTYMKAQLKELIDRYDPAIMWFDGDWTPWWTMEDGVDLYNYLRELSPHMIINNRVAKRKQFKRDFGTPENFTPGAALDHVWESCWTVNHSWGFKKSDTKWKSTEELIQKLIDIVVKGGNLLLNVGPQADGSWPEMSIQQFEEMGAWTSAHSEALYGAEFVAVPEQTWGRVAQLKGSSAESGQLFLYLFDWPKSGKFTLSGVQFDHAQVYSYDQRALAMIRSKQGLDIELGSLAPTEYATVLRLDYEGLQTVKAAPEGYSFSGDELVLQAAAAKLNGPDIKLVDNSHIGFWTDPQASATWEMNVPAPGSFRVKAVYACAGKFAGSEVQLKLDGTTLRATVPATKNWNTYELLDLGEIELNQVGTFDCEVGFGKVREDALFNLKTLIFVSIGE